MPGDESSADLFEDDQDLEQAAQQMFEEEEDEDLARMVEGVEATPIESLPGWVFRSEILQLTYVCDYLPRFDLNAGKTWVYPNNMSHRDYQ